MASPRPQLSLVELWQVRWLLGGGLSLLAIATVLHLDTGAAPVAFLAMAATVAATLRPTIPTHVPKLFWTIAVPLLIAFFAVDLLVSSFIEALVRLNILLVLFRALQHRTRREDMQLVLLALFLVTITGVLTVSMAFGVHILAFTALAIGLLFTVTLSEPTGRERPPPGWDRPVWSQLPLRLWRAVDLRLGLLAVVLFGAVVAVSGAIFVAIPRFQIENHLRFLDLGARGSMTGFSDQIGFRDVTDIRQDQTTVLRVEADNPDLLGPAPYLRMVVLDEYAEDGFRVSAALHQVQMSNALLSREDVVPSLNLRRRWPGRMADRTNVRMYLEPGVSRYLPLFGTFRRVNFPGRTDILVNPATQTLSLRSDSPTLVAYRVDGAEGLGRIPEDWGLLASPMLEEAGVLEAADNFIGLRVVLHNADGTSPGPGYPETLLGLPSGEADRERLRAMVRDITGGETVGPTEFAARASVWLARRHAYALSSTVPAGEGDTLVRWLDSGTPGHCEYFAGSLVLLARAAGFPARIVTGFRGGSWNAFGGAYLMVRNSDAHAWTEIYDGNGFWVRFDPTPGSTGVPDVGGESERRAVLDGADRSWGAYVDSLRLLWYQHVVNYDQQQQLQLLSGLRDIGQSAELGVKGFVSALLEQVRTWLRGPWDVERIINVILGLVIAGAFAVAALAALRHLRGWRRDGVRLARQRQEAAALLGRWRGRFGVSVAGDEPESVRLELERIRFGPVCPPRTARLILRRARRSLRAAGRRRA